MDPVTHGLTGWLIATGLRADARTRTFAAVAAIAPDFDWAPILWGGDVLTVHRAVGHNVWVGVPLAAMLAVRSGERWRSAAAFYLAFLSHLAWDLTFVDWPEKLLWPLSQHAFPTLGWQPLSAQHLLSLGAVCACTVVVMIWTGFSPRGSSSARVASTSSSAEPCPRVVRRVPHPTQSALTKALCPPSAAGPFRRTMPGDSRVSPAHEPAASGRSSGDFPGKCRAELGIAAPVRCSARFGGWLTLAPKASHRLPTAP